jgi:hypothetical protein
MKPADGHVSQGPQCQDGIHSHSAFLKNHERIHVDFPDLIMKIRHQGG